jgi:hypothetical protein
VEVHLAEVLLAYSAQVTLQVQLVLQQEVRLAAQVLVAHLAQ